jgi:ferric-dicitrate binding protein FerR (iron transport regulator)
LALRRRIHIHQIDPAMRHNSDRCVEVLVLCAFCHTNRTPPLPTAAPRRITRAFRALVVVAALVLCAGLGCWWVGWNPARAVPAVLVLL